MLFKSIHSFVKRWHNYRILQSVLQVNGPKYKIHSKSTLPIPITLLLSFSRTHPSSSNQIFPIIFRVSISYFFSRAIYPVVFFFIFLLANGVSFNTRRSPKHEQSYSDFLIKKSVHIFSLSLYAQHKMTNFTYVWPWNKLIDHT